MIASMRTLLIDGYNLIYRHQRLSGVVEEDAASARRELIRELSSLASSGYYGLVMVVFDAARSRNPQPLMESRGDMQVVFTRRGQTADSFIEAAVGRLVPGDEVHVATSDRTLRDMVSGFGAVCIEGADLFRRAREALEETREEMERMRARSRVPLEERVSEETRRLLNKLRFQ